MSFPSSLRYGIALCLCITTAIHATHAQTVDEALLKSMADAFKTQYYKLEKIQEAPAAVKAGVMPPVFRTRCYADKASLLVVAVYSHKPKKQDARLLVMKKQNGTVKFDEYQFQKVEYNKSYKVYYSLVEVAFPPEANYRNCETQLQAYDEGDIKNKVWFITLTK